eukprot:scaffold475675_cov17-Prasinocladus_malaysianus.AAC.1
MMELLLVLEIRYEYKYCGRLYLLSGIRILSDSSYDCLSSTWRSYECRVLVRVHPTAAIMSE